MTEKLPKPKGGGILHSRFGSLAVFGAVFLAVSVLLRTALLVQSFSQMDHAPWTVLKIYAVGLFFDAVTCGWLLAPLALFVLLAPDRVFRSRLTQWISLGAYFLAIYAILFDVAAEWLFWDEFNARFNFVAVDYLVYTQEVVGNIWQSYPVAWILAALAAMAAAVWGLTLRPYRRAFAATTPFRRRLLPALAIVALPLVSLFTVDSAQARVSPNYYSNELSRNGVYNLVSAFWNNIIDFDQFYLTQDDARVFARARQMLAADNARFIAADGLDITREITNPGPERRHNVVMVVVESLSAEYVGALGDGRGLTPNLDALAKESLLFRHFYATGTRTDRGLEAVTLSLPPTPGQSLVKRPDNGGLFSMGPLLAARGYDARFLYGGRGFFDNMNVFYRGNGFAVVDQQDFAPDEITFSNAWGVCDEDLFRKTIRECDKSFEANRPFFHIVMTTSNHRPFTYPPKIDVPSGKGRHGAVKYADFAIGAFLQAARKQPWFDNTIFLILADHCAGSAGKTEVPVDKYHIPLVIYAPQIVPPGAVDTLASQIDVPPTLLGLLHWSYRSKFFGRDVLRDPSRPGRALVGIYQKVGLYRDGKLGLLLPNKQYRQYRVDPNGEQTEMPADADLLFDTLTYHQSAAHLLRSGLYKAE